MKKNQVHRRFSYIIGGDGNQLPCERAAEIATEHFSAEYCEEAEAGVWIVWDRSGRAWIFQKKLDGFIIDTPYISNEDVNSICELMVKLWEAGMNREIEQLNGPFDPKDGLPIYYRCEKNTIRYGH